MIRVGFGYDCHRFDPGRPLVLAGVRIDGVPGLAGHSDADVVMHAIIDALLGAAALADIGEQFPDTDDAFEGADSGELLGRVCRQLAEAGWRPVNCDVTIVTEQPKLSPWKPAMRANIAGRLGVDSDAVSVKAKTHEGMGAIGRGEGAAAMAVTLVEKR